MCIRDSLARSTKPFEVRFRGIGSFDQKILFLDVVENPALHKLHRKVIHDLEEQFDIQPDSAMEADNVRFHATVCRAQTPDVFDGAEKLLRQESAEFTFQATEIGIFYHLGGDHSWIVYRQMPLLG
jgi:2'-5' RNA ligase